MNQREIVTVLEELHKITGFRISLHSANFEEIAAYPSVASDFCRAVHEDKSERLACMECDKKACMRAFTDKKTYIYECRYGLSEAVSPLYNFGTLTGFLMMGQVAKNEDAVRLAEDKLTALCKSKSAAGEAAAKIPLIRTDMMSSYVKIMTICAQYLTLSNALIGNKLSVSQKAMKYIDDNFDRKITAKEICNYASCSKSTLFSNFKKSYGVAVNEYINEKRLGKARLLLREGNESIATIALDCGFSDQSYFSKVFSAKYGITPTEYRLKKDDELQG